MSKKVKVDPDIPQIPTAKDALEQRKVIIRAHVEEKIKLGIRDSLYHVPLQYTDKWLEEELKKKGYDVTLESYGGLMVWFSRPRNACTDGEICFWIFAGIIMVCLVLAALLGPK